MSSEPTLSTRGKAIRVAITALVLGLVVAGTLRGQDDHFPFGPFRMYATADKVNRPVKSTRLEAVRTDGRRLVVTNVDTGLRRAEIEGQMRRFRSDPELLGALAEAYDNHHPDGPRLRRVEVVVRHYELKDGKPTGRHHDRVTVYWDAAEARR